MRFLHHALSILVLVCLKAFATAQEPPRLELVLHTGHTAKVRSVALSGDGKHLVTGSDDNTAILWDAVSGRQRQAFKGHTGPVLSVAVSGDGKLVATGSASKTILWEAASGKKLQTLQGNTYIVTSVALSGDGKLVVTGSLGTTAILWDTANGKKLQTFLGAFADAKLGGHRSVALSSDGKFVVTAPGETENAAILWEAASGKQLQTFEVEGRVRSVALSGDGKYVVTGGQSTNIFTRGGTAVLWEAAGGKKLQTFQGNTKSVNSVALSGDGKFVVTGSKDDLAAILWEAASGKKLQTFYRQNRDVTSVALSGDGKLAATGSSDFTASLWETASGKKQTLKGNIEVATSMALSGDGKHLFTGGILWDMAGGKKPQSVKGGGGHELMALSRDGKLVALGATTRDKLDLRVVYVSELPTGKSLSVFDYRGVSDEQLNMVALTGDGKYVVTGAPLTGSRTAIVWEAASGRQLNAYGVLLSSAPSAALIGGKHLITGAVSNKAILWEPATGKIFKTFEGHTHDPKMYLPILQVAVSGNGKYVVSYSEEDHTAILWETASGKKLQTFKGHTRDLKRLLPFDPLLSFMCVAVSGDGKHVVTADYGGVAYLWETAGGKKLHTFKGLTSVAFSDNGKHLCTLSGDGLTRLWDPVTGKERCRLYSIDGGEDWLVVTPEGLFDGSEGAWRFVANREPGILKLIDDDATRKRFHRPSLLADIWKGK